ncbi:MAG: DUF1015 domain-containing protein [Deltaproteobacteria bacterium]|nr:DUF1015 domain-containing protein [Deltaproteobacteria bacterium]
MAEIMPFRGALYAPEKIGDLNKVMAPPYDVISPKLQDDLYSRHSNNVVRLELNKITDQDSEGNDRYSRAGKLLDEWLSDGAVKQDARPSIYYYTQTYTLKSGLEQTRKGFVSLVRLEEFGKGIHPHERTLSGPKADRLKLMTSTDANLSCIFSLYSEPELDVNKLLEDAVKGEKPYIDVKDDDKVVNRLWRIDDVELIKKVQGKMRNKALFIADGHHRYETALNYRNMMREKTGNDAGDAPFNFIMMYFSNMDDVGMTIWPTHRVVHSVKGFERAAFHERCGEYFDIDETPYGPDNEEPAKAAFLKRLESKGREAITFGLQIRGKNSFLLLTLKAKDMMDRVFGEAMPDVFKGLDVTVLHSLVLTKILGITREAQEKQENLVYVKSLDEALEAVKDEANQMVFLLNPTKIEQVKAVAEAGLVMPQKSTYFYPKLLSGLVINIIGTESGALTSTPA